MKMADFFAAAGTMLNSYITEIGESPRKQFTAHFIYQRGRASYDGHVWTFEPS